MVRVQVINAHTGHRLRKRPIAGYVRRVLREEEIQQADLKIVCIGSRCSRGLNREYLGHDYVTDVISFPLERGVHVEGEVYVNLDRARSQAREYGVSFRNEVARLAIHGTLHLAGYDDTGTMDARRMKKREEEHLRFWFPNVKEDRIR